MRKVVLMACDYSPGIRYALENYGIVVIDSSINSFTDGYNEIVEKMKQKIIDNNVDYVFSFDFSPFLSRACLDFGLTYISWVWDCPHANLWSIEARNHNNRIFLFDYDQYLVHINRGLSNVFYLPLASDCDYFSNFIEQSSECKKKEYKADVSFVGSLYTDLEHNMYDQISYLQPYTRGYLDSLFVMQKGVWGANFLRSGLTERVWEDIRRCVQWDLGERYELGVYEENINYIIQTKIAQIERIEMCNMLSDKYDFALYTNCNTESMPGIRNRGYANYLTEMPLIFSESKINIHITMRAIESGIPLRVMDVLACGGFLLTNYQREIAEYFVDGKDLVIYHNLDDMQNKIDYYLNHEDERKEIAQSGKRKVSSLFTYEKQIKTILEIVERRM